MSDDDIIEDLILAQTCWHKARREGKYFRAERWAQLRDLVLDHVPHERIELSPIGCKPITLPLS